MKSGSATGSRGRQRARQPLAGALGLFALGVLVLALPACSAASKGTRQPEGDKTILLTKRGNTSIQVTEGERNGNQVVQVHTVVNGKPSDIMLNIDQPVYEVQIPLDINQVIPQQGGGGQGGGQNENFKQVLFAQYLQKAQQAMTSGDYNGALKQVDTVLQIDPNNVEAHAMKGSVYYALGNYDLANQEWQTVLDLDPSNQEVLDFQKFLKNHASGKAPKLPGAPAGTQPAPAPAGTQGGTQPAPGGTDTGAVPASGQGAQQP